ncbi:hypothetical protein BJV77DRAFT_968508 [Russula vinacea]|nr:hypothetical protein BJV77DRAFT_968508 [Russula vinacea]
MFGHLGEPDFAAPQSYDDSGSTNPEQDTADRPDSNTQANDDNAVDPDEAIDDDDIADANTYEALSRIQDPPASNSITQVPSTDAPPLPPPPPSDPDYGIAASCETVSPIVVDPFSSGDAGTPITDNQLSHVDHDSMQSMRESPCQNIWAPFNSQCDWEVTHWAKTHGSTSSAVTGLLAIPEVVEKLGLSYRNVNELNKIIDQALPGRPTFKRKELIIDGQSQELYFREIIPCIRSLYGDPRLVHDLVFAPERHYTDETRTCRIYNEMHTGNWWWLVQLSLEKQRPGATIIPIILSSDKTQLTLFHSKSAYPVYLTIGNIRKDVRRKPSRCAQMLVGYIPTTRLEHMKNQTGRRRALANLFHGCMRAILGPIDSYGETGIAMRSADGVWRRCHPVLAAFVGDYPEQTLVTCTYSSRCPKCLVPPKRLGDFSTFPLRDPDVALEVYALADGDPTPFHTACRAADLKPVYHPFWETLPLSNIFLLITPDILHQLLQGVMKHVLSWVSKPSVFGSEEIDVRCRRLPPNHNITLFTKGITTLSRVSGHEHKKICCILLGLVVDLPLREGRSPVRLVQAIRALLEFLYLAQYSSHSADTLSHLDNALSRFHDNKQIFVELGARKDFNFPKLHSLIHYVSSIKRFGTTDNYNTEQSDDCTLILPRMHTMRRTTRTSILK